MYSIRAVSFWALGTFKIVVMMEESGVRFEEGYIREEDLQHRGIGSV